MNPSSRSYFLTADEEGEHDGLPVCFSKSAPPNVRRLQTYLVQKGIVTVHQISQALDRQRETRPPIGDLAIQMKLLSPRDVNTILNWQQEQKRWRFGEIAVDLGYLSEQEVETLLDTQVARTRALTQILEEMGILQFT